MTMSIIDFFFQQNAQKLTSILWPLHEILAIYTNLELSPAPHVFQLYETKLFSKEIYK